MHVHSLDLLIDEVICSPVQMCTYMCIFSPGLLLILASGFPSLLHSPALSPSYSSYN